MSMNLFKLGIVGFVAGILLTTALILSLPMPSSYADMEIGQVDQSETAMQINADISAEASVAAVSPDEVTPTESVHIDEAKIEPVQPEPTLHRFVATAYCLRGTTASGAQVNPGSVAADPSILPIGSVIRLHAGKYSGVYTVLDTGAKVRGRRLDLWLPTAKAARLFGVRKVKVEVIRYGWDPTEDQTTQLSQEN